MGALVLTAVVINKSFFTLYVYLCVSHEYPKKQTSKLASNKKQKWEKQENQQQN